MSNAQEIMNMAVEAAQERIRLKDINAELLSFAKYAKQFAEKRGGSWAEFESHCNATIAKAGS